jgi:hypothetical protein
MPDVCTGDPARTNIGRQSPAATVPQKRTEKRELDFRKGESHEEIRKCPQEFCKPATVSTEWNDRGWSGDDRVGAFTRQFVCV